MSSLRALSPVKSLGGRQAAKAPACCLGQGTKAAELGLSKSSAGQKRGTASCPEDGKCKRDYAWPGGTLPFFSLQLLGWAGSSWEQLYPSRQETRQTADTYPTLQICSFSLILIPTHKHFSYIHWLHYHCRSVINKLKGRIVIQLNLGEIFK